MNPSGKTFFLSFFLAIEGREHDHGFYFRLIGCARTRSPDLRFSGYGNIPPVGPHKNLSSVE